MPPEGEGATGTQGDPGNQGDPTPWLESIPEEHKETLGKFESREKLFETIGYTPPKAEPADWREGLSDDEKKTAERFTDPKAMIRSIQSARQRESLVRVPGKDATDEEKAAYNKAIGVPETAEGYVFKPPEGETFTPEQEEVNKQWGERLHSLGVPVPMVDALLGFIQEDAAAQHAQTVKEDKDFVEQSEAELKALWKGEEYEKNKTVANKAFKEIANRADINFEDLTSMETKEGRFLMDDPKMMKMFAAIGREMAEGGLGPTLTSDERDTMEDQLTEIRGKIAAAQEKGNSKEADKWYQKEQALIAKMNGNKKIA